MYAQAECVSSLCGREGGRHGGGHSGGEKRRCLEHRHPYRLQPFGAELIPDELEQRKQAAAERYLEAGADLVIDSIRELPDAVAEINRRMAEQEAAC